MMPLASRNRAYPAPSLLSSLRKPPWAIRTYVVIGIYYTWIERTVEEQRLQREMEQSSFTESFGRRIRTFGFCPDHRRTIFSVFYVAAFSDHVRKFTLLRPEKKKKKNETANRRGRGTTLPLSDLLLISCYCATCLSFVRLARPESFTTKDERERERERERRERAIYWIFFERRYRNRHLVLCPKGTIPPMSFVPSGKVMCIANKIIL